MNHITFYNIIQFIRIRAHFDGNIILQKRIFLLPEQIRSIFGRDLINQSLT